MKVRMKVLRGSLSPADNTATLVIRKLGLGIGEIVEVDISKIKNPQFNRYVHVMGKLMAQNVSEFEGRSDYHEILKEIQEESGAYCDRQVFKFGEGKKLETFTRIKAKSLGDMDQHEFQDFYKQICHYIAQKYWPDLNAEAVAQMAEMMPDD